MFVASNDDVRAAICLRAAADAYNEEEVARRQTKCSNLCAGRTVIEATTAHGWCECKVAAVRKRSHLTADQMNTR
jgi:hypothetical protein